MNRKKVILVDHNEITQAVDGIQKADILEIVDHHRLGGFETLEPVFFRNQPVGCTATIITQLYDEKGVVPDRRTSGIGHHFRHAYVPFADLHGSGQGYLREACRYGRHQHPGNG